MDYAGLSSRTDRSRTPKAAPQSVVLEYVTDRLVETVTDEIARGEPVLLVEQPLIKAQAKDYVRQTQERLIGTPIVLKLLADTSKDGTEQRLLSLLTKWRSDTRTEQGYGPGNVLNLLCLERANLRGLDLSGLWIRQAYLAAVDAQDTSLVGAHLSESVLAEAFHFPPSIALSSDGALLAAGTSTGELWLWRVADRTPMWVVAAHAGGVWSVALSTDGQVLVSGGADGQVRVWDTNTGQPLTSSMGHKGTVWGVAVCAEAQLVASGGADGTVRLWDASSERAVATLVGHSSAVWGVALATDGKLLVSGGADGTVRLWETSTGRSLATLQGHAGTVWTVALSTEARLVASAGEDGTVRLWEAVTGHPLATLQGHTGTIWGVAMSSDGRLVASAGEDGRVRLWESASGHPLATLQGHTGGVLRIALSGDGHVIASGSADGTVRLWSLTSRHGAHGIEECSAGPAATLRGYTGTIWGLALSADGHVLASGDADGTVRLWEAVSAGSGRRDAAAQQTRDSDDYPVAPPSEWRTMAALHGHEGPVSGVALSADGRVVASGGADATVRIWESNTGQSLAILRGHTGGVWRVALSADAHLVASGGFDGIVRLWSRTGVSVPGGSPGAQDLSTWRLMAAFPGHTSAVSGLALSTDGQFVASGDEDGTVRVWEISTGKPVLTMEGHSSTIWGVALSATGALIASGGTDGAVRMWSGTSGEPLITLQGNAGGVFGVALSADGDLVASGGFDGTVRLWDTSTGTPLLTLRADRRYERLDITGLTGVTTAQRTALLALGAVERAPE